MLEPLEFITVAFHSGVYYRPCGKNDKRTILKKALFSDFHFSVLGTVGPGKIACLKLQTWNISAESWLLSVNLS